MATRASTLNFDVSSFFENAGNQFRGLNTNEPGQWPTLPKLAAYAFVCIVVLVMGWLFVVKTAYDELGQARAAEPGLRENYRTRVAQAVNLAELSKQKLQVEEYVTQLEKQLPGKAEMDALLSDINQAGLGRGLQFELFRPGAPQIKENYVEQPIALRVTGRYHDIGSFAADIANLSRIVTLQNLSLTTPQREAAAGGNLAMEATAFTYRYLDDAERAQQKAAAEAAKKTTRAK
jgi:type IV pilus assembly protein PilO